LPKIAVLNRNQEVEKVGDAADWSQIRVKQDGTIGWVDSRYLSATPVAGRLRSRPRPLRLSGDTAPLPEKSEIPAKAKPTTPTSPPAVEKAPRRPSPGKSPRRP